MKFLISDSVPLRNGNVDVRKINTSLMDNIRSEFPEIEFNFALLRQVFNDLASRGFVKVELISQSDEGEVVIKAKVTEFGRDFLKFISS